jgi:hypothetical protein
LLDIPDHGAHRRTDPDTSVEAAMAVDATRLEALVAEAIRAEGTKGATTRELSEILHMDWGSITPRCAPLVRKRLIYDSGERRQWRYGRKGIVWKACNISVDSNI